MVGMLHADFLYSSGFVMSQARVSGSDWLDSLRWRYAVKKFDATRKIDATTWSEIEASLVLTPSSFGLQPWKFFVIHSPEVKSKLSGISWNQTQPADCSHMVILAARRTVDESFIDHFINHLATERGVAPESLAGYRQVIVGFANNTKGLHHHWSANQVYIALGQLLATAAALGVDACPMEGIEKDKYDQLLNLTGTEYTTAVGCALGYRHREDKYAEAPKVRFPASEVVVHV